MRVSLQSSFNSLALHSVVAAALFLSLPINASRAEFLDDLFGDDTPAPSRSSSGVGQQPYARDEKPVRHTVSQQHKKPANKVAVQQSDSEDEASDNKQKNVRFDLCTEQAAQKADAQKPDAYLYDKDLKKGDSVMTPTGVLVFKGNSGCPHRPEEFVALSSSNAPKGNKKALATIDAAAKSNWK